jgi:hypothetical protein
VNDIVLIYDRRYISQVNEFQMQLLNRFEMKCLRELKWFLDIQITRDRKIKKLWLFQEFYIDKLINKFNINLERKTSKSSLFSVNQKDDVIKYENIATLQQIQTYQ